MYYTERQYECNTVNSGAVVIFSSQTFINIERFTDQYVI